MRVASRRMTLAPGREGSGGKTGRALVGFGWLTVDEGKWLKREIPSPNVDGAGAIAKVEEIMESTNHKRMEHQARPFSSFFPLSLAHHH